MLGSGGLVVIDEDTCMVDVARRIMHFYAHESCGWCIPCREGTAWLRKMLDRFHEGGGRAEDIPLIGELSKNMLGRSFLSAGRCRGDAHDQHREEMAQRIRGASAREVRVQARGSDCGRGLRDSQMAETKQVTFTIDDRDGHVRPPGTLVIEAAKARASRFRRSAITPDFSLQAACRMCLVEVEKDAEAADRVHAGGDGRHGGENRHPQVHSARKDMIEFLLSNHPLDCPVCDKGGECELQDMMFRYGAGQERFIEEKLHIPRKNGRHWFITMRRAASSVSAACAFATKAWT